MPRSPERGKIYLPALLGFAALCWGGVADPAAARADESPAIESAKALIRAGELTEAERLLRAQDQSNAEVLFLEGQVAGRQGRWSEAEALYRRILAGNPDLPRVRLELAQALFEQHQDIAAEYQFRLALLGELPGEAVANVSGFLEAIRERKTWTADLSLGAIADSNMNRASSAGQVAIFGLPFILSQQARQQSGFGATIAASGEYAPLVAERMKMRAGASFFRNDYQGGQFDDMQVQTYAGPQIFRGWGDLSLLGLLLKRWYGNAPYDEGYGARIEGGWNVSRPSRVDVAAQAATLWYPGRSFLNGAQVDFAATYTYAATTTSFWRGSLGLGHQDAQDSAWRNDYGRAGVGYGRNLAWGVSAYAEADAAYYSYDGQTFDHDRRDWLVSGSITFSKSDWKLFAGFSPSLALGYQRDLSTIALYSFKREFVQLGLSRHF